MNLRLILLVFAAFLLKNLANSQSPVKDFCVKNKLNKKSVIIALSLSDCAVCYTPPDELLSGIRKSNINIPVYVVTDEEMTEGEKVIFRDKFGFYSKSVDFICDKTTYRYMLAEKSGIPSVCCVSEKGDVLVFKHLKHDDLEDLFNIIKPSFEIFLINKTELKTTLISPKKHSGALYMNNNIYLFHSGANVIAKYNMRGENVKNLLIDSIDVDYLQLAREVFPDKIYKSSELDYNTNHPKRSRLIRPINVIKMGKDSLCVLMDLTACGDTVLNNKPTKYRRSYSCVFLINSDLNYLGAKLFFPRSEADITNLYMRGAYFNKRFYLGRFDSVTKRDVMAEYEIKNSGLSLNRVFNLPQQEEQKNTRPMIPSISMSRNDIYISDFKANDKGLVNYVTTNKLNLSTGTFSEVIATELYWAQMYSTKKGNYLLWTIDAKLSSSVKAYDKATKQITDSKDMLGAKAQNADRMFFVFDGFLHEYTYIE